MRFLHHNARMKFGTLKIAAAAVGLCLPSCDQNEGHASSQGYAPNHTDHSTGYGYSISLVSYRVKKGDTLIKIAKQFNLDPMDIAAQNTLEHPYTIHINQELRFSYKSVATDTAYQTYGFPAKNSSIERNAQRNQYDDVRLPHTPGSAFDSLPRRDLHEAVKVGGDVPFLRVSTMPPEARPYLAAMSDAIHRYAQRRGLTRTGPPLCGQGACEAFLGSRESLSVDGQEWKISNVDAVFTDKEYYQSAYGSRSRDAYKIRKTLERLSSLPESGWVRIALNDLPHQYGYVTGKKHEGKMYIPTGVPEGALLLYDPNPKLIGKGGGGEANGHIEWVTAGSNGERLHVFTACTPVHGGSAFCREQFSKQMEGKGIRCYAFVLVPPEIKALWLSYQHQTLASER